MMTPLHYAVKGYNLEGVQTLLQYDILKINNCDAVL